MRNTFAFFPKLASDNIRKNSKVYIPYMTACAVTSAVFYIIKSLSLNPGIKDVFGGRTLSDMLDMGSWIAAFFSAILLFYTNSFLMKRRKKELGIFNILGMEKRHLALTLAYETIYVYLITVIGGIILGIALDKLMFMIVLKIINAPVPMGFFISPIAVLFTAILFLFIFSLVYLKSVIEISLMSPMALIREKNAGEKEPKAKWLIALLGVITLTAGYIIALLKRNPLESILQFFIAVILVIIGTYLLFTAGSIALLKLLSKNKKFYYKTNHFISISGMIYRMKQNAVGLASICILSTMVLVTISSTGSLILGLDDLNNARYPFDFNIYYEVFDEYNTQLVNNIRKLQFENNIPITEEMQYSYYYYPAKRQNENFNYIGGFGGESILMIMPLSDYNRALNENKTLNDGELLMMAERVKYENSNAVIFGKEYTVKEHINKYPPNGILTANISDGYYIVVPDGDEDKIAELFFEATGKTYSHNKSYYYGFNTMMSHEEQIAFYPHIYDMSDTDNNYQFNCESKAETWLDTISIFGGMFFVGILLGLLFTMATVLIIYYKQISEGYEDRERYEIMQKVGLTDNEIKASIHSQILTVFFLPLLVAGTHICFAFPIIKRLLGIFNMTNLWIFIGTMAVSFSVFSLMYVCVYMMTAKTYYKIVRR